MNHSRQILQRVLVRTFYRRHAGLFLFLFFLFFGIISPGQQLSYHYTLILEMLGSALFFSIVLTGWLVYGWFCAYWVWRRCRKGECRFLFILPGGWNRRSLRRMLAGVQLWLLLPVCCYAVAIICVALYKGQPCMAALVALIIGGLTIGGGRVYAGWLGG